MCNVIRSCMSFWRKLVDYVLEFLFSLVWERNKKSVPDLSKNHACLADSAVVMAKKIKTGELKSEDLVQACIERIKEVNPIINAVVDDRYEEALAEAREIDNRIAKGLSSEDSAKPFLGVPFTSKESQAAKGMSFTLGLWDRRNERATEDSEAIIRLKEAGAILLALTNLPELLIWSETRNPVYGTTNNPHHTGRSPGGSSGAEAALMASYATPISLSSDVAGSTRIPSFCCGMIGYHPTVDITPLKGMFGRNGDEGSTMFCLGFISKHVEDHAPLMKVLAGDKAPLLKFDRQISIKDIKVFYTESINDMWMSPVRSDLKKAMKNVVLNLKGVLSPENSPRPYYHKAFNDVTNIWRYWMSKEPEDYFSLYTNGKGKPNMILELFKKLMCSNKHCLNLIVRLLGLKYWPMPKAEWAEPLTDALKDDLFSTLDDNGVLLFPSAPIPGPYHYFPYLTPYNVGYWAIINVLKCPSVQVPLGMNSKNVPLGIQVVAAPNNDVLCLTVAKYLEQQFGGAIMACKA